MIFLQPSQCAGVVGLGQQQVIGHNLGYFFDVIRVENFHADGEVAAEIDHGSQYVHGTGVPVDDGALRVILFEQVENFFLAGFGVQVDEFVLLGGGGDEVLQHFPLGGIG